MAFESGFDYLRARRYDSGLSGSGWSWDDGAQMPGLRRRDCQSSWTGVQQCAEGHLINVSTPSTLKLPVQPKKQNALNPRKARRPFRKAPKRNQMGRQSGPPHQIRQTKLATAQARRQRRAGPYFPGTEAPRQKTKGSSKVARLSSHPHSPDGRCA